MDLMARFVREKRTKGYIRSPVRLRGFTRNDLACLLEELSEARRSDWYVLGTEIGVQAGKYSEVLCRAIPRLLLNAVDPYESDKNDEVAVSESQYARHEVTARARLKEFNHQVYFFIEPSLEAVRGISDHSLDFVYIDGNHTFDYVMQDLIEWSKRVRSGGIVAGHDYLEWNQTDAPEKAGGVVAAVQAYTKAHAIEPWFLTDEPYPSYFWEKP